MCLEYAAIAGKEKSCLTSEQTPNNHEQVNHRGKLDVEALKGCSHNVSSLETITVDASIGSDLQCF